MSSSTRIQRVGDMLQRVLSELIAREIQDPRLTMVSITSVEVSRDLSHAKIYVSVLGDEQKITAAMKALEKASGFLRRHVAQRCELRITPQLHFFHDKTVAHGRYMSDLIDKARSKDESSNDEE
jgi:ribosome-binding factor A